MNGRFHRETIVVNTITFDPLSFPVLAWSFDISEVVKEIGDLDLQKCPVYSSHINDYFRFYSLNFTDPVKHYFGYVKSDSFRIATHVFIPPASQEVF